MTPGTGWKRRLAGGVIGGRGGNKYGARRALGACGRSHDSTAEADRCRELHGLQEYGVISELREQTRVELEPDIFYKTDFDYVENGRIVYEDVKGITTERFRLITKIWALHGPGPLRVTQRKGSRGKFVVTRTIFPPIPAPNNPNSTP